MKTRAMVTGVRIIVTFVGVSAYLLLAVWGWGGFAPFFAHPALIALAASSGIVGVVAIFAGGNLSSGVREDRSNRWVLAVFTAIGLAIGFLPAYTDRLGIWTLDGDALRWGGLVLYLIGCAVRMVPVFVLGNRFSGLVAIQPGHTLVTTGIYSRIRNPSYLGALMTVAGWSLVFRSIVGLLLSALFIPVLVARMNAEERLLRSQFGAEYDSYLRRTSRLIPHVY